MQTPEAILPSMTPISSGVAQRTTRNAVALGLSAILTKALLFFWQVLLARRLGVEGYGVYATISALMIIGASISEFGMGLIVIRNLAQRPQDAGRYLAVTLTIQPLLAVLGYVTLMVVAEWLGYSASLRGFLSLAALSLLIDALGNMVYNQLIAFERMVSASIVSIGHVMILIILGTATLSANGDLWSLYKMILLAGSLRVIAYWVVLLRIGIRPVFPITYRIARYLLVNGAPFALTAFLSMAYIHSDKLLATALIGTEGTGQLMASFIIVFGVIELLSTPALVTVFPLMSRLQHSGQQEMFRFVLEKLSFFSILLSVPLAIYTSLMAVPLSRLVFGNTYLGAAVALRIMIWYTVVAMVTNVFSQALTIQNRQKWLLAVRASGLGLSVLLNLILLPRFGISGAAVAMLLTETVILALILRSLSLPVEWWQRMIAQTSRLGLATLGLAAVVLPLQAVHPVLSVLVSLPAYAGLLLICGAMTKADRALLSQLVAALPGGARVVRAWKR